MAGKQHYDYDLAIIGGGSAGIVAGNVAGALGARVALVEKSRIGGECLWTGCVPSKALLYSASVAKNVREAGSFGLKNKRLSRADCAGAFDYVRAKIQEVRANDASEAMLHHAGVKIFHGAAKFAGPHRLRTPAGDIKAANFLIATGSSPRLPEIPGLSESGYLTNVTLFDLDTIPERVVFIGGGYIAVEMGQALNRLGANVTILQRGPRLLPEGDHELAALLTGVLRAENVQIYTDADVTDVRRAADEQNSKIVTATIGGEPREFVAEEIVVATGRQANTTGLNLEAAGVTLDDTGNVIVNEALRTDAAHIWACGDVIGRYLFSHLAEHEAKAVVRKILFPGAQNVPLDIVPWATFTEPEMAGVGLTEETARERYGDAVQILRHEFFQDDRAIVESKTTGLVKVLTMGINGAVVGAQILGPHAGEMIHEWVIAMRHNLPVRAIADLIHVYPTVSVSNQRAAQRWYADVFQQPVVRGGLRLFGLEPRDVGNWTSSTETPRQDSSE